MDDLEPVKEIMADANNLNGASGDHRVLASANSQDDVRPQQTQQQPQEPHSHQHQGQEQNENDKGVRNELIEWARKHSIVDESRYCWVCFATDEDDELAAWVQPCRCIGTTKWVNI